MSNENNLLMSEEGKKAFLAALNERFSFTKDGKMIPKIENAYEPIILSEYLEKESNENLCSQS